MRHLLFAVSILAGVAPLSLSAGDAPAVRVATKEAAIETMRRATAFMTGKVAVNGGYVWSYLPDLTRRWGELEARPTMVWVQSPGTASMGHVFLDAYHATADESYYRAAEQTAGALIAGQLACGGWNYAIDFAGEKSLREWYDTIGRNAWRLEEFQHYYGNATFDDSSTVDAARYLLRFYLEKRDAKAKAVLDRALQFILDAQYPVGGWPQRAPPMDGFSKNGAPDYTGYITFNDGVTHGIIEFLLECHQALRDERLLEPIRRGMGCFLATQHAAPQAGWSLQHTLDLEPAGARTYEPKSLATHTTAANIDACLGFYRLTGDTKFLARVPEALAWLESVKLSPEVQSNGGTHPTFVELGTNRPLFIHRRGSNVVNGAYFADHDWHNTIGHYSSFRRIDSAGLRRRYEDAKSLSAAAATKDSPLLHPRTTAPFAKFFVRGGGFAGSGGRGGTAGTGSREERLTQMIAALNPAGYWPGELSTTSHPFSRHGGAEVVSGDFSRTQVGDETDTSPFRSTERATGISTATYIRNMTLLITFVADER